MTHDRQLKLLRTLATLELWIVRTVSATGARQPRGSSLTSLSRKSPFICVPDARTSANEDVHTARTPSNPSRDPNIFRKSNCLRMWLQESALYTHFETIQHSQQNITHVDVAPISYTSYITASNALLALKRRVHRESDYNCAQHPSLYPQPQEGGWPTITLPDTGERANGEAPSEAPGERQKVTRFWSHAYLLLVGSWMHCGSCFKLVVCHTFVRFWSQNRRALVTSQVRMASHVNRILQGVSSLTIKPNYPNFLYAFTGMLQYRAQKPAHSIGDRTILRGILPAVRQERQMRTCKHETICCLHRVVKDTRDR